MLKRDKINPAIQSFVSNTELRESKAEKEQIA